MLNKKDKIFIGIITILSLLVLGLVATRRPQPIQVENLEEISQLDQVLEEEVVEKVDEEIYVHISGNVARPGLIRLFGQPRLSEAIDLCGGLLEETDMTRINLALKLEDQARIHIPRLGEEEVLINPSLEDKNGEKIDINNSSKEELLKLPGIGEKKAEQIIEHRQANSFKSIDDIMEVSGIGEKTFEGFKDMIIVK